LTENVFKEFPPTLTSALTLILTFTLTLNHKTFSRKRNDVIFRASVQIRIKSYQLLYSKEELSQVTIMYTAVVGWQLVMFLKMCDQRSEISPDQTWWLNLALKRLLGTQFSYPKRNFLRGRLFGQ